MIDAIRGWVAETGGPPAATAWVGCRPQRSAAAEKWKREHPRWPSASTVSRLCGSWPAALAAAGCGAVRDPLEGSYCERVADVKRLAAEGHSTTLIAELVGVSTTTVRRYVRAANCGSCGAPVTASVSGYCAPCVFRATHLPLYTRQEILQRLGEWEQQTGGAPRSIDWAIGASGPANRYERDFPYWPPASSAVAIFGSWRAGLAAAGLRAHTREPWTRQDILAAVQEVARELGRPPTSAVASSDPRLPTAQVATRYFETWNATLRAARLKPNRVHPDERDDASIIAALQAFAAEHGRAPTGDEFNATQGAPAKNTVTRHFGSWNAALDAAGIARLARRVRWDQAAIITALQSFAGEHGRAPQARDFAGCQDGRWPSHSTVAAAFGSWTAGLRAAGL